MNEMFCIWIRISLKFVPKSPNDNNAVLVQVMVWRRTCHKPLREPRLTQFPDAYIRHKGWWINGCSFGTSYRWTLPDSYTNLIDPGREKTREAELHGRYGITGFPQNMAYLTQTKMAAIKQRPFSNEFSWRRTFKFQSKSHWNMLLMV